MEWQKKILIFLILFYSLLANEIVAQELAIHKIENDKIQLLFNWQEKEKKSDIPIFNYILELDSNYNFDFDFLVNSSYPSKKYKTDYFKKGLSKNEEELENETIVSISNQFFLNNKQYIQLTINPVQYVNDIYEIAKEISITINNIENINILNTYEASTLLTRQNNSENPVLLIIAPDGDNIFNLMTPLINWKKIKGYKVFYYQLNEIGYSNSAIKTFIQNAYNNWEYPPNYVCIIGDADGAYAVPTFTETLSIYNGESDHPYTLLDGNDNISDVAIGRLSIRSLSDLATIINKIINYEQYPYTSGINWFERALCVGDPSISGSSTVITNQLIAELMIANGFDEVSEVYQYPFVNQIENIINSGVSFYNYRGFAGSSGWEKDGADNLANGYMLPVVSVITCDTGSFLEDEQSISENFLKAGSISIPKGGIAGIGMSTQGTHTMFNNCLDYGLYHALFVEEIENLGDALNYTKNNLWFNYPYNPNNYVDIFSHWINLMGDPTLSVWTASPQSLSINDDLNIPWGQDNLNITILSGDYFVENAKIVITDENLNLISTGISDGSGEAYLNWEMASAPVGTYNLLVTKHNYIPQRYTLEIIDSNYSVNVTDFEIIDSELSSELNPNDQIFFNFNITNFGLENISDISGEIILNDSIMTISEPFFNIDETIISGESSSTISISGFIDGNTFKKEIDGTIILNTNNYNYNFPFSFIVQAPDISAINFINNNDNNFLNPNNLNEIYLTFRNDGEQASELLNVILSSNDTFVEIENNTIPIPPMAEDEIYTSPELISIDVGYQAYPGMQIPVTLSFYQSEALISEKVLNLLIGETSQQDPLGPDQYGYFIYDFNDTSYSQAPIYNWIEIDPYLSGLGTILIDLNDDGENQDDVTFINLPFPFRFYGEDYQQLSISTNGWIKPGLTNQSGFRNWRLPGPGGPSPMISAFWDDLETGSGRICVDYDSLNNWYIIEWSNVQNGFDNSPETFQVIIYDQDYYPTITNDNIIKIQYKNFNNVNSGHYDLYNQWHGNYASIGIENQDANIGLEYTWNNQYPISASILSNETALLITTNPPVALNQLLGDVNQDSQLDVLDIVFIIHEIINSSNIDSIIIIGDANQDGQLDVLDIVILVNTILEQ